MCARYAYDMHMQVHILIVLYPSMGSIGKRLYVSSEGPHNQPGARKSHEKQSAAKWISMCRVAYLVNGMAQSFPADEMIGDTHILSSVQGCHAPTLAD